MVYGCHYASAGWWIFSGQHLDVCWLSCYMDFIVNGDFRVVGLTHICSAISPMVASYGLLILEAIFSQWGFFLTTKPPVQVAFWDAFRCWTAGFRRAAGIGFTFLLPLWGLTLYEPDSFPWPSSFLLLVGPGSRYSLGSTGGVSATLAFSQRQSCPGPWVVPYLYFCLFCMFCHLCGDIVHPIFYFVLLVMFYLYSPYCDTFTMYKIYITRFLCFVPVCWILDVPILSPAFLYPYTGMSWFEEPF